MVAGMVRAGGRGRMGRATRFAARQVRRDVPNSMASNGELQVQRWALQQAAGGGRMTVLDVGANHGEWSAALLDASEQLSAPLELIVHCFEPSAYTAGLLRRRLDGRPVVVNQMALSDTRGEAVLHVANPGGGTNSLVQGGASTELENVLLTTVDDYLDEHHLEHVDLVKVDTEGNDLAVLRGARRSLAAQRIGAVQFEYNQRWIDARGYLRDAFDLLEPCGYQLGKVTRDGIEVYPGGWDWELETFVEGNYLAFRPPLSGLAALQWWKDEA